MSFSSQEVFNMKLSKKLIIDLIEDNLIPVVFINSDIVPHIISCGSHNQKFELSNINLFEFKNEVFNDTEIDHFNMTMSDYNQGKDDLLILLKESYHKEQFVITLESDSKMWIDDNLLIIKDFLNNYIESKPKSLEIKIQERNITRIDKTENYGLASDKIAKEEPKNDMCKNSKHTWQRGDIIAVIGIVIALIIGLIQILNQ